MNILVFTEYFPESNKSEITGGVEARYFYITKHLSKNNNITIITSWRKGLKRKERINNLTIFRVGPHHSYSNSSSIISRLKFTRACYKKGISLNHIDIIEGGNFLTYVPAYLCAKKLNKPCIATYHEVWVGEWIKNKGLITGIFGSIWERADLNFNWTKFIAVSEFTKQRLIQSNINPDKITVVNNGINLAEFKEIVAKKSNAPTICCASRLIKTKQVKDFIKAIAIVKQTIPNIKCIIIGTGEEKNNLKKLTKDLNLTQNIKFTGLLEHHKDVLKHIKSSNIFCNPSSVEGFGIVVLEAMALGTPIITSDIAPFKELNKDNQTGFLFKTGDHKMLSKKLIDLLNNKKKQAEFSKECIKKSKKYDWKLIAKQMQEVYNSLK